MQHIPIATAFSNAPSGHLNVALDQPIDAYVNEQILYNLDPSKNDLVPCQIVGFRAAAGLSMTASVLIDGHNLYSEIPFHMIYMTNQKPDAPMRLDDLVYMNNPLQQSITLVFNEAIQHQASRLDREYLGTIRWDECDDLTAHIMALKNGQLSLVPDHDKQATSANMQDRPATIPDFLRPIHTGPYQEFELQGFHAETDQPLTAILYHAERDGRLHVPVDALYTDADADVDDALSKDSLIYKLNTCDFAHYTYYEPLGRDAARCYFQDTQENRFGTYLGTIDYYNGGDFIAHLVKLDNDQVALLPSHKVQFNIDRDNAPAVTPPRYAKLSHAFVVEPRGYS